MKSETNAVSTNLRTRRLDSRRIDGIISTVSRRRLNLLVPAVNKTILATICLVVLSANQLHAQLYAAFNTSFSNDVAYIEYDTSIFNLMGPLIVTSQLGGASGPINGFAFDSNGNLNITVESSPGLNNIETWDVSTGTLLGSSGLLANLNYLTAGPNGNVYTGFNSNGTFSGFLQYDPVTFDFVPGSFVQTNLNGDIGGLAFDSNGNLNIGVGSRIETWDVSTNTLLGTANQDQMLSGLALAPNGDLYAGTGFPTQSGYIQYDPATFQYVPGSYVETPDDGAITGLAFDSNGNLNIGIESSPGISIIDTWDVSTSTLLGTSPPVVPNMRALANQVEPQAPEQVVSFGIIGDSNTATLEAAAVATAEGHFASILTDLSAGSLSGIDVIWALNSGNDSHLTALITDAASVSAFVNAGGVLIYHDRFVADANTVLPGGGGITFVRETGADTNEINVINNSTLVTNGPGGIVGDTTLDDGFLSSHGFATAGTLPGSATSILGRTLASDVVDFRYEFGAGEVYYSSIPLDFFLAVGSSSAFADIYAPNVAAYAASLANPNPVSFGIIGDSNTATLEAAAVVTEQRNTATILTDLSAGSLSGIDVIWALNSGNDSHLSALITDADSVSDFVNAGGVLMYHDRFVADANTVLPGGGGITFVRETGADTNEINVINNSTLVTNGPGGIVDDTTLDGGSLSSHGFATAATLPGSATSILGRTLASDVVDFRYEFGAGEVYYSSIPLDFFLAVGSSSAFADIYAPNVAAYSASRISVDVLLGDVNLDGAVNLLDVSPFISLLSSGGFQVEADLNGDGEINLLDVSPFIALLAAE